MLSVRTLETNVFHLLFNLNRKKKIQMFREYVIYLRKEHKLNKRINIYIYINSGDNI